ncbi:hypothetical protein ABB37_01509 [Leptomonas pyrrhocoris]|uniref:Uncharacterized protein n=1 Tax=Leptomonas pyrrhocoris TaxID=157538 RepID=A0A0N0DZF2_LEPPY|nr:hypothetical protein ABB37_01509 [Leptomonas pyrrhocoris]KPA85122.1 hypothetical protein ABB37_01509 [Leptomonas pyrrhocoris]|eukprot:XP_015663561.1 hypothetical protein ABB37_01509 [Leptomonas pyrrhocoris]
MSSHVLPIGIPPRERTRLCRTASEEVCSQAASHVRSAAQVSSVDAAAEPYVRAVYVYQASTVAPERVSIASGEECGSYLRSILRACVASYAAGTSVPCWLTVVLEDTCIVQHAVFAMTSASPEPQNWTSATAFQSDVGPFQAGVARWSLVAQPVPCRTAAPATAAPSAPASRDVPKPPQKKTSSVSQASTASSQRKPHQSQESAAPPSSTTKTRHTSTTPCAHSAAMLAKAMGAINQQPPPQKQQQRPNKREAANPPPARDTAPAAVHYSSSDNSSVPSESSSAVPPQHAPLSSQQQAPQSQRARLRPPHKTSAAPEGAASQRSIQSSRHNSLQQKPNGLVVYDSPQADLVVPSDGRQWGDSAYRTCYSPRREELWDIADAVMTHNYAEAMISPEAEPAYIDDYHDRNERGAV